MKHFAFTLAVAGMVGSIGTFAAAQSDVDAATTTCADFMAMSVEDQRAALDTLNSADASADEMDAEADTSGDSDAATSMSDDTVSDPVSDSHDADTTTDTEAATTDLSAEAEADADASEDPEVQAIIAACEGNEDALVADQVSPK